MHSNSLTGLLCLLFGTIQSFASAFLVVRPFQRHPSPPSSTGTAVVTTVTRTTTTTVTTALHAKSRPPDNNDNHDDHNALYLESLAHNRARTDVRNFLTQRAIQSFIFLLISCRDQPTVKWLETQLEVRNLEQYHGTGAFNLTKWSEWDSTLQDLLHKPKEVVIVSARRRGRGQGGWSKDNPHTEVSFVEFEIDMDPVSLVSRIISVREQIAGEWVHDLDTMRAANDMILESYHDMNMQSRDLEECLSWTDDDEDNDDSDNNNNNDDDDGCVNVERLRAPYSDPATSGSGDYSRRRRRQDVFDHNAMMMLTNAISFHERSSSPYRKGNFDLLCLLATQEAIHRVLREYRQDPSRDVSREWLREFYIARVPSMFDGNQEYGRAEDFLEELLSAPPTMKKLKGGRQQQDEIGLIDPLRIAEDVIRMRSTVASDWKDIVSNIPSDHMGLRKEVLARRMGDSVNSSPFASSSSQLQSSPESKAGSIGANLDFEEGFQ